VIKGAPGGNLNMLEAESPVKLLRFGRDAKQSAKTPQGRP